MRDVRRFELGTLLLIFTFCQGALGFQQPIIRFNPQAPLSPLEQEPMELEAYEAIRDEADAKRRLSLINRFLGDHAASEFRHLVLRSRWEVRIKQGDSLKIIEAAEEALNAEERFRAGKLRWIPDALQVQGLPEFRFTFTSQKAAYYQSIVEAYRNLGDFQKMVQYGELGLESAAEAWNLHQDLAGKGTPEYQAALEQSWAMQAFFLSNILNAYERNNDVAKIVEYNERILELTPDDLQTLMKTSRTMAEHPPAESGDRTAYLQRALRYADQAMEQLQVLLARPSPVELRPSTGDSDDERRAELTAEVHYTFGLIHFQLEDWEKAADAFKAAIQTIPDDSVFHLMLGLTARRLRAVDAMLSAYARAVYLEIPQPEVRSDLEMIYRTLNGSLEGLDELIKDEGSKIEPSPKRKAYIARRAYIDGLIDNIDVLPTVFPPNRFCYQYYEFLASQDLRWAKDALEIGVGSGVNSFILLHQGAGRVVGTDVNANAIRTFTQNASKLGYSNNVEGRLVPLSQPEAFSVIKDGEKFDLIISNPPWEDHEPKRISEYALFDSNYLLLHSMLVGLSAYLRENGKAWLLYGDPRVIPSKVPPTVEIIMQEATKNNLDAKILYSDARCWIVEVALDH